MGWGGFRAALAWFEGRMRVACGWLVGGLWVATPSQVVVVNDNYSSLSTTIKTHCDTGLAFYVVSVSLTVPNPLGPPLRRSGVFGAARRQRRSGAEGAGGRAGSAAALFLRAWHSHGFPIELQNDGVMDQAIHRRHRGHRVLENLVPLREDQIAAQQHAAPLIALGQKGEEHFHLLPRLLHVAQVVQNNGLKAVQLLEQFIQAQFPLGRQQLLHQLERRGKTHRAGVPQNQLPAQGTQEVGLAPPRQPEDQQVLGPLDEATLQQRG